MCPSARFPSLLASVLPFVALLAAASPASADCGDGVVDPGETCDPPSSCPTSCSDGNACTTDTMTGDPSTCDVACASVTIAACTAGDDCCPDGCAPATDSDCSTTCGNDVAGPKETCDPPSTCLTSCDDGNACTQDILTGRPNTCNTACSHVAISACAQGDGCCPPGCTSATDDDCSTTCDDGTLDPGETCDPQSSCPASCDDGNACTIDLATGSSAGCSAACAHVTVTTCADGDGCCPIGCTGTTDDDCSLTCGNSVIEPGETCDPPSSCPIGCDDGNACTVDQVAGGAVGCSAVCSYTAVVSCADGNGCCPPGCTPSTDTDCSASCGDSVLDPGETCDPPSSCPTSCDDGNGCTLDVMVGSASSCNVTCIHPLNLVCTGGDDCCPAGCTPATDSDCSATCGDTVLDQGETCDPKAECPTTCADSDACTIDVMVGSAANCNTSCLHESIVSCRDGDGCCPAGCDHASDQDCSESCGNGTIDPGETCDPPSTCPSSCDDGDACTFDMLSGSAAQCTGACTHTAIDQCLDGDGCCPAGCNGNQDSDCPEVPPADGGAFPDAASDAHAAAEGGAKAVEAPAPAEESSDGCGCAAPGTAPGTGVWGWLVLASAVGLTRRRLRAPWRAP